MQARQYPIAIAVLSLAGLTATLYLTYLHLDMFAGSWEEPSLCGISRTISCEAVSASSYSAWFGVPVAWFGTVFYMFVLCLSALAWKKPDAYFKSASALIFSLAAAAVILDAYLAYIMAVKIKSLCLLCLLTYLLNLAILFLAYRASPRPVAGLLKDAVNAPGKGRGALSAAMLATVVIAVVGGSGIRQAEQKLLASFDEAAYLKARANMPLQHVDTSGDPYWGAAYPIITIVEFSDFQCPHCRRAHRVMESLLPAYQDRVKFVFKNMPLGRDCNEEVRRNFPVEFHFAACDLARLGEAAAEQNRFWDMHDLMFELQPELPEGRKLERDEIMALAKKAGMDMERLEQSLAANTVDAAIAADVKEADRLGINSTPTFIINGLKIEGLPSLPVMKRLIEIELEKTQKIEPTM